MVSTVAVTADVVVLLPAVSVALAVKLWLPSVSALVVKLQLLPLIVAAPRSVAPSNTCTDDRLASLTVPDSASVLSLVTPPLEIVVVAPLSVPIVLLIVSLGLVVSTVAVTAAVVVLLPAVSVALAVKLWLPSVSALVVKLQLPPLIVAAPRSVAPSNTCTDDRFASLTVPDSASVLSLVTAPLEIVVVAPVSVPIVPLIVSLGLVVSTVAVTTPTVVLLPTVSVALAVKMWLPSDSGPVVKLQLPPLIVAAPRSVAPSNTCTDNRFASLTVPDSASVLSLVTPPLEIVVVAPVSVPIVLLNPSLGLVVSTVAVIAAVVVLLPAASVALAVKLWLPSTSGPVVKLQLPPLIVAAPRSSVPPSNTCTDDRFASLTVPDSVSVLSLVNPPLEIVVVAPLSVPIVLLIVSLGLVVSSVKTTGAGLVPVSPAASVSAATMLWTPSPDSVT